MCNLPTSRKGLSEAESRAFAIFLQTQDIDLTYVQRISGNDVAIKFKICGIRLCDQWQISMTSRPVSGLNTLALLMPLRARMMAAHEFFS
jgi:hypothetical protein